jgi:hypothetical protein
MSGCEEGTRGEGVVHSQRTKQLADATKASPRVPSAIDELLPKCRPTCGCNKFGNQQGASLWQAVLVVDYYCGGGAFLAAAKSTARSWPATERDEAPAVLAWERLAGVRTLPLPYACFPRPVNSYTHHIRSCGRCRNQSDIFMACPGEKKSRTPAPDLSPNQAVERRQRSRRRTEPRFRVDRKAVGSRAVKKRLPTA